MSAKGNGSTPTVKTPNAPAAPAAKDPKKSTTPESTKADTAKVMKSIENLGRKLDELPEDIVKGVVSGVTAAMTVINQTPPATPPTNQPSPAEPPTPPAPPTPAAPTANTDPQQAPPAAPQTPPAPAAPQTPPTPATTTKKRSAGVIISGLLGLVLMAIGVNLLIVGSIGLGIGLLATGVGCSLVCISLETAPNHKKLRLIGTILSIIGGIIILSTLINLSGLIKNESAKPIDSTTPAVTASAPAEPTESAAASASPVETGNEFNKPDVTRGESIPPQTEFQVEAGDIVSGDVYLVTADNTKVPLMDDDVTTALVVVFEEGARLCTGDTWGCYLIHQATDEEIANAVSEKEKENFERVDLIHYPEETQSQSSK